MKKYILVVLYFILSVSFIHSQWVQTSGPIGGEVYSLAANGTNTFLGTNEGLYISSNTGLSWSQTSLSNQTINCITISGTDIFVGSNGLLHSTNNGQSWIQTSLYNQYVYSLSIVGTYIFAGTYDSGVYVSSNYGQSWSQSSLNNQSVNSVAASGTKCICRNKL